MHRLFWLTATASLGLIALAALADPDDAQPPVASTLLPVASTLPPVVSEAPVALAPATGPVDFTVRADRASVLMGSDGLVRVELSVGNDDFSSTVQRQPTDLTIVLDTSGSMSGSKIADAKAAARELVAQLGDEDRFALVSFDNDSVVHVPLSAATPSARQHWLRQIDRLSAGGSTYMSAGLLAAESLQSERTGRATRTILISDGLPNGPGGLVDLAHRSARREVPLTTVGIGEDYDESLLTSLADAGTGNFYAVDRKNDLAAVFANEFITAHQTVASGLVVEADLAPGVELVDASGYFVEHGTRFAVGSLFASQRRRFWVTLRVPAGRVGTRDLGTFHLRYATPEGGIAQLDAGVGDIHVVADEGAYVASIDAEAWGQAVVEEEYNYLRSQLSEMVQQGDQDGAIAVIADYRLRNATLNDNVGSIAVTDNLVELDVLETDLQTQFEGADQARRRNRWAKDNRLSAYQGRRGGQARSY